jgi:hypothetical protein
VSVLAAGNCGRLFRGETIGPQAEGHFPVLAMAQVLQRRYMRHTSLPTIVTMPKDPADEAAKAAGRRRTGVDRLAWWLDNSIAVPGTRFRIGFDALIGLIPGVGDLVGTLLSGYIIAVAASQGLPRSALARMGINVALEAIVGLVPIVGDLFDAAWKSNQRNIRLMAQFRTTPDTARRQSRAVVAAWAAGVIVLVLVLGVVSLSVIRWIVGALGNAG